MSERKTANQTWEGFADQLIRDAQASGAFDNLPGRGQPIPGIEEPVDEDWWIKRKLKSEQLSVLPPLLQARLDIEQTRELITSIKSESLVREQLEKLRTRVAEALRSPLPSPPVVVLPVDVEGEVTRWKRDDPKLR